MQHRAVNCIRSLLPGMQGVTLEVDSSAEIARCAKYEDDIGVYGPCKFRGETLSSCMIEQTTGLETRGTLVIIQGVAGWTCMYCFHQGEWQGLPMAARPPACP